ncbi:MAG TPA: phosphate/phosphite/phosphonate ABC transporter substrate-binding protein [Bryobacteraceae bacterium]|nr:phosphate/phosphite/phosphonate ABC transporter substrate-binding protein [Bryobacteraceae bacterium]
MRLSTRARALPVHSRLVALATCILIAGCSHPQKTDYIPQVSAQPPKPAGTEYAFGVLPLHNAIQLYEIYQPLIDEINHEVSGFTVRLETARDYPTYEKKLTDHNLDFAMLSPHLVISAEDFGYHIVAKTADRVRGVIVVRKDSHIRKVRDLKGAYISFAGRTDLSGTMMQKVFLRDAGLDIERMAKPKYVGSQESALMNVYFDLAAAGCVSESTWITFRKTKPVYAQELEVRWTTAPLVGLGIMARNVVPREHVRQVVQALYELNATPQGQSILEAARFSKFQPAGPETYDPVWEFLNDYRRMFGRTPTLGGTQ